MVARESVPRGTSDREGGRDRAIDLVEVIERLSPRLRQTYGASELIAALHRVAVADPATLGRAVAVASSRLRLLFYASIGRRPPLDARSLPSYVMAVKRRYRCASGNMARQTLAEVEGYRDWREVVSTALRQPHPCPTSEQERGL